MPERIEDYALLGDLQTAALVGRTGSIDWLCLPRFDSASTLRRDPRLERARTLAAGADRGRAGDPAALPARQPRSSRASGQTETGRVRVIDFMPVRDTYPEVIRIVECLEGHVRMRTELVVRFDYGSVVPWVRRTDDGTMLAVGGPDALCVRTPVDLHGEAMTHVGRLHRAEGRPGAVRRDVVPVVASGRRSRSTPSRRCARRSGSGATGCAAAIYDGDYPDAVRTSLMVLKAQTYAPTGGIVAAPTTSLPGVDRRSRGTGTTATAGFAMRRSRSTR